MINVKKTLLYRTINLLWTEINDFLITLGNIGKDFLCVAKTLTTLKVDKKALIEQCARFSVDSLPITLTIVAMTSIIIAMQIAPELAKQGAGNYVGSLSALVMVRELSAIMSGFAIISMIGSSYASEIASMAVTEQISAMRVLKVDPIEYLIVPRFLSGVVMMPFVVIVSTFCGLICAAVISNITAEITYLNFISSMWHGLFIKDIFVALLKSSFFGVTIALISCSCGYSTRGGALEVGISTTRAVVWSFVAIAIWDYIFATVFYL